mmetsp:Transcript_36902/g.80956  ORF Transcript_36902/g.80956 Transcript_36902/m.80956 type:complete len:321 (-) Transcript_36902:210-1172(-)
MGQNFSEVCGKCAPGPKNYAFVFIKPHANTEDVRKLVTDTFQADGIRILSEGSLSGKVIDEKKLIDKHYYAIASKATIQKPSELNVPNDKFEAAFGVPWKQVLASGKVFNAMDGCKHLGITPDIMAEAWGEAKFAKKLVKLGGGFYCGLVEIEDKEPVYIFNGFFMSMRSKFTGPGASIHYYSVEFAPENLPWSTFRGTVLGATDPVEALPDSLRGKILAMWEGLGLDDKPNVGDNGVHASASPFEGLAERMNWLGATVAEDPFGKMLLEAGLTESTIKAWSLDPQVTTKNGKGSIFDQLEDLDTRACIEKLCVLSKLNS